MPQAAGVEAGKLRARQAVPAQEGDHNATCSTCHVGNDYSRYTCFGCHEHTPSNIRAKHEKEGIRNFENCVACHRSASGGNEREGRSERRKKD